MNVPTYLAGTTQAQAHRILRAHVYTVLEGYQLTPTYWSVIGMIVEAHNGMRASEIAAKLHIKAPQVTMITQQLSERGLIQSVPHQLDKRAKLLAITPAGKRFVKNVELSLSRALSDILQGVTEDDLTSYQKVLTAIIINGGTV